MSRSVCARVIATIAATALLEHSGKSLGAQATVAAGRTAMISVAGRPMRVRTAGLADRQPGRPLIVLESGAVQSIETWDAVFDGVASLAPVIAYDRRGIGRSEFDGQPQTLTHVTESLHALLAAMTVPPPYVLVGHSYGGVLIRAFARTYPTEVAGLVYLDAPNADITIEDLSAISPAALGLVGGELDSVPSDLPVGMRAEFDNIRRLMAGDFTELKAARPPAGIPTAVLVAAGKLDQVQDPVERATRTRILGLQMQHQQAWALSSPRGLFAVTGVGGHYIHQDNRDLTIQAIRHVLFAATSR